MDSLLEIALVLGFIPVFSALLYFAVVAFDNYSRVIAFENSRRALGPYGPDAYIAAVIMRRGIRWFLKAWARSKRGMGNPRRFGAANRPPTFFENGILFPGMWLIFASFLIYQFFSFGWYVVDLMAGSSTTLNNFEPVSDIVILTLLWGAFGRFGYFVYIANPRRLAMFRWFPGYHREPDKVNRRAWLISAQRSYRRFFLCWLTPIYVSILSASFAAKIEVSGIRLVENYAWVMLTAFVSVMVVTAPRRRRFLEVSVISSLEGVLYLLDSKRSDSPDVRYWIYLPASRNSVIYSVVSSIETMVQKSPSAYIGDIPNPNHVLLYKVARSLRDYLSSMNSLKVDLPQTEERILRLSYITIIDPNDERVRSELNILLGSFDNNGNRSSLDDYPSKSHLSGIIEASSKWLDFGDRVYRSSKPLVFAAIAICLFALGYINKETLIDIVGIN